MEKKFYIEIGAKIQKLRKSHGLSQKELADRIGKKSATYINLVESGKRKLSLHSLTKIATALELPINKFLDKNYKELNSQELLELALISDKNISSINRKMILEFVEFLRQKNA